MDEWEAGYSSRPSLARHIFLRNWSNSANISFSENSKRYDLLRQRCTTFLGQGPQCIIFSTLEGWNKIM